MRLVELTATEVGASPAAFHALAAEVYAADPVWVPQSDALFDRCFAAAATAEGQRVSPVLCLDGSTPLARAAAILNPRSLDESGRPQGYIAFFECLRQTPAAGRAVLEWCERRLSEWGARSVQAPRLDNLLMGLQVKGFDLPQTVYTWHNPPYYEDLFLAAGYRIRDVLVCYHFTSDLAIPFPLALPGLGTRVFDRRRLREETQVFHYLQERIFSAHPGYVPRTLAEDGQLIESFLPILDDDLVIIAEDRAGNPVGLLVCLPDVYRAYMGSPVDSARLISIGAVPGLAGKGVGALMGLRLLQNLRAKGYRSAEGSWIRRDNFLPRNLAKRFGGRPGREFALFEKALAD